MTPKTILLAGLMLVAALTASGLMASKAAAQAQFVATDTPSGEPVTSLVDVESEGAGPYQLFHAGLMTVQCEIVSYESELPLGSAAVLIMWPKFEGCTTAGFETHATVSGCNFAVKAGQQVKAGQYAGELGIGCLEGAEIDFRITENGVTRCTLQLPNQGYRSGVTHTNRNASNPPDVTSAVSVSSVEYTTTGTVSGCFGKPSNTYKDGTFTSAVTMKATKAKVPVDFAVTG